MFNKYVPITIHRYVPILLVYAVVAGTSVYTEVTVVLVEGPQGGDIGGFLH